MNLNSAMRISSTGLAAERFRMDTISANIANANTIKKPGADAWHRQDVILSGDADGVRVVGVVDNKDDYIVKYEPENPYADENGQVFYSNVDPLQEMVNMMSASRAYEANIEAFNSAKSMIRSAMEIGKV
ncbi:MAG: flagellar basal body rod protein FlgC [Chlorobia bacterium]|nr:flagellar basal body rod protein FlgC [Fimbriimonadaceae bacterium]